MSIYFFIAEAKYMSANEQSIFNFTAVSDKLAIGGQPATHQFKLIADAGYSVILQLVVKEASYSPADEAYHVQSFGLQHEVMHISFAAPTIEDVERFFGIMEKYTTEKVFVHCAVGYCTSGLISIYLMQHHGLSFAEARKKVAADWKPNLTWQQLIYTVTGVDITANMTPSNTIQ